jgi:glucan biosynthesis protein C
LPMLPHASNLTEPRSLSPVAAGGAVGNGQERYHSPDALRAFAALLVVGLHSAIPFMERMLANWPVVDGPRAAVFDLFVLGSNVVAMSVFFLLAGYFTPISLRTHGVIGFLRRRMVRIAIPLVVSVVVLVPLIQVLQVIGFGRMSPDVLAQKLAVEPELAVYRSTVAEFFASGRFLTHFTLFHLWFLWFLLIDYVLFVPLFVAWRAAIEDRMAAPLGRFMRSWTKPFCLAVPTTALIYLQMTERWANWISPSFPVFLQHSLFFVFGWMLYEYGRPLRESTPHWPLYLLLALFVQLGKMLWLPAHDEAIGLAAHRLAASACAGLQAWLLVLGTVGFFVRWCDRPSRPIQQLGAASYWIYLAHPPLVILLQMAAVQTSLPAGVKFAFVVTLTLVPLLLSYRLAVSIRNSVSAHGRSGKGVWSGEAG